MSLTRGPARITPAMPCLSSLRDRDYARKMQELQCLRRYVLRQGRTVDFLIAKEAALI